MIPIWMNAVKVGTLKSHGNVLVCVFVNCSASDNKFSYLSFKFKKWVLSPVYRKELWWTRIVLRLLFKQLKVIVTVQWMFIKFISNMPKSINLFYCLWLIIMTVLFYLWLIIVYFFVTVPYWWPLWYGPTLLFPWVPLISNAKRQPRNQHDDPEKRCLYCGK